MARIQKTKKKKSNLACYNNSQRADTGFFSRGHHNHRQSNTAHHHATGKSFSRDDSTTKAVLARMEKAGVA